MFSSITVNGILFPVLCMSDVSMLEETQEKHHISVKTTRFETLMSLVSDKMLTKNASMVAFFSPDAFDATDTITAPVMLVETLAENTKVLQVYYYYDEKYVVANFTHRLNGFLGCTMFLNLGFYLLDRILNVQTRSMHTIYFVDRSYLDREKKDEPCDTSLETLFEPI